MKIWDKKILPHFFFWILYYLIEIYLDFLWSRYQFPKVGWHSHVLNSVVIEFGYLFVKIPLIYLSYYVFIKRTVRKSVKIFLCILFFSLEIFFHRIYVHDMFFPKIYDINDILDNAVEVNEFRFNTLGVINSFMDLIFMVGLFFGIRTVHQKTILNEKLSELHAEKLDSELSMLKAQINPHFLFNSLNNIYGFALKKADETPQMILQLSKIMRYSIYEATQEKVTIEKDIENIKDFIEIQKIRHYFLIIKIEEKIDNPLQEIAPLILIQFVENAFKHGVSESMGNAYIRLFIELKKGILTFTVINSKENNLPKSSTKLGLKNIKRQLELLYPKHTLEIKDQEKQYEIHLKIDLQNG